MGKKKWDIEDFLDIVECDEKKDLTVQDLVELSGFSRGHFYKWFQDCTGVPVGLYLRRRCLRHAASDIAAGRYIKDIAFDCGFQTESGFISFFKKEYGLTPSEYRTAFRKLKAPSFEVWDDVRCVCYGLAPYEGKEWNPFGRAKHWLDADFQSVSKEEYRILSEEGLGEIGFWSEPDAESRLRTYYFGPIVRSSAVYPRGMKLIEIPAATYAVFSTIPVNLKQNKFGFRQNIEDTKGYIFTDWLKNNGRYQLEPGKPIIEYYKTSSAASISPVDLYVPVSEQVSSRQLISPRGDMSKRDYVEYVLKVTGRSLSKQDLFELCDDVGSSTIHHVVCDLQKRGKVEKHGTGSRTTYQYISKEE